MLKKIFNYAQEYKKKAYISVIYLLFSVVSEIIAFYMVYLMMDHIIAGDLVLSQFIICSIAIIVCYGLKSLFFSIGLDQSHVFAYNTLFYIRKHFSEKIKRVSLGTIINKGVGAYRQNFVDDIEHIEIMLAHGLPEGIPYIISCLAIYITLFIVDYRIGFLSLITIVIGTLTMYGMVKVSESKAVEYQNSLIRLNNAIVEYVKGMEVVKVFNKSIEYNKKINDTIVSYKDFTENWYRVNWNYMAVFQAVVPSTIAFILPVGLYFVYTGSMSLSTLLFCIILALSISSPLLKLMNYFPVLHNIIQKIEKLEEAFNEPDLKAENIAYEDLGNDIEFKNVTFSYKEDMVLHDISFKINANHKIGIVGESGSGKSTIGKLIMHYWDINDGQILIGGVDITKMSLQTLMSKISYVSQDNFLFNMSIKENLLLAKPDASDFEIVRACKLAQCHDFIMSLEHGYETKAGDSGNKLSGGERQRITIARAMLKDADIVILDEATSFTDPENDVLINQGIDELSKNKTVITIAHKLSNVKQMDGILLVDKGRLIDFASHDQLIDNMQYRNLFYRHIKSMDYQFRVKEQV